MPALVLEVQGDIIFRKEDKKWQLALDMYQESSKIEPNNAEIFIKQGKCYEKLREFEKATEAFKQAIKIDDKNAHAHFRLGWVCIRNN